VKEWWRAGEREERAWEKERGGLGWFGLNPIARWGPDLIQDVWVAMIDQVKAWASTQFWDSFCMNGWERRKDWPEEFMTPNWLRARERRERVSLRFCKMFAKDLIRVLEICLMFQEIKLKSNPNHIWKHWNSFFQT
jgi:hypothetical protein